MVVVIKKNVALYFAHEVDMVQDSIFFHEPITSKPKLNCIIFSHLELCSHVDSINTALFFLYGHKYVCVGSICMTSCQISW